MRVPLIKSRLSLVGRLIVRTGGVAAAPNTPQTVNADLAIANGTALGASVTPGGVTVASDVAIATGTALNAAASTTRATITVTAREFASSTTDSTTYLTGTFTPTPNTLQILDIVSQRATALEPTSVTGCGLTWVKVTPSGANPVNLGGAGTRYLTRWRAMGPAPTNGALTITFAQTMTSCAWAWTEASGVDTSGTNGSGAIVQTVGKSSVGNVTTLDGTLAALEHANNVHLCTVALNTTATVTPDADFAELGDDNEATNAITIETQRAVNQTVCDATFASANAGTISSELKAA